MSVLVYTENWDGQFKKSTFELVSYASEVAKMLNTKTVAVSLGNVNKNELEKLAKYGADKIVATENDIFRTLDNQLFTKTISDIAIKESAAAIILSNNNTGKAIAPAISVRLKAGIGAGVNRLPESIDPFIVVKRAFSGNAFAKIVIKSPVKIITLARNSFRLIENEKPALIENFGNVDAAVVKTSVTEVKKQSGKILLTDADIVVSGGRGMKSPDNWGPLVELADLLGAATACSRPVSDEGWRGHEEHTGQTGKIIAPDLYIAIGISGATQHLAGVSASKYIVAVNTDKDAPIFEAAQYGIVGDAQKILPRLVDAVREIKSR
jgi:electron transfer flavoprotein alpha subunit